MESPFFSMILSGRKGEEQNLQELAHNLDTEWEIVVRKRLIIHGNNHWKAKRRHKIQLLLATLSLFALHLICAVFILFVLFWS